MSPKLRANQKPHTNPTPRHSLENGNPVTLTVDIADAPWSRTTIGELFDIGAGKSVTPAARNGESKFPFLRTSNVFWGRIDTANVDTMCFTSAEIEAKSLQAGDLLVCEGGDIGRSAIWNGELEACAFQNHLHRLRPKGDDVAPRFFMYYLQAGFTQLGIYEGAGNKTTIPNLSRSRLAALEVPTPPKPEQQKIAAVLSKLQRAIATQDRLIAATGDLKQSAMQRLFTHGLRGEPLKDTEIGLIPESWDVEEVRAIATIKGGKRLPKGVPLSLSHTPFPYIRVTDFDENSVDLSGIRYVPANVHPQIARYVITANDIYISIAGSIGLVGMIPPELDGANLTENAARLIAGERMDPAFMMRFLSSGVGQSQISSFTSKNAQPKLALTRIDDIRVPVPKQLSEQRDIAAALATLDRKLAHHRAKRAALDALFQTTLHQLMTAQVRVADLDIDTSEVTTPDRQGEAA